MKILKNHGLINNNKSSFKKTEEILRNYNSYKYAVDKSDFRNLKTKKIISIIETALNTIEDDPYYSIIEMAFFEGRTREQIAEWYDVDVKTISRNKNRLIDKLKLIIFSDKTIDEIYL